MHVLVQPAGVLECLEPKDPHVILHYTPAEPVELQPKKTCYYSRYALNSYLYVVLQSDDLIYKNLIQLIT